MLARLMDEIRSGGTLQPATLAIRLHTTPEIVGAMLDHLEQMGLLTKVDFCSENHCMECPAMDGCSFQSQSKLRVRKLSLR